MALYMLVLTFVIYT